MERGGIIVYMGNIRHRIIMKKEVIRWLRRIVIGMIGVQRSELE
jgi:hypothetical protein